MNKNKVFLCLLLLQIGLLHAQTKLPAISIVSTNKFTDDLVRFTKGIGVVKENYKYGLRKVNGDWLIYPSYDYISDNLSGDLILVQQNQLYGFVDFTGKVVIKPAYKKCSGFENGYAFVYESNETKLIDKTGAVVFSSPGRMSDVGDNGWIPVALPNKTFKYVDFQGRTMLETPYDYVHGFNNGIAIVQFAKDDYCLIDEKGNVKSKHYYNIYKRADNIYEISAVPAKGNFLGLRGLIDKDGNELLPPIYKSVYAVGTPWGVQDSSAKYYYIDPKTGKQLFNTDFDNITSFTNGAALVKKNMKIFYIDKTGKAITQSIAGNYDFLYEGEFIRLTPYSYWSVLDTKGNEKEMLSTSITGLNNAVEELVCFYTTTAGVKKYGLINGSGKVIATPQYAEINILTGGVAAVRKDKNGPLQCIDSTGKLLFNGKSFGVISKGEKYYYAFPEDGKSMKDVYFMDVTGKKLALDWSRYSSVGPCQNNIMPVYTSEKLYGYIDITGKEIVKPQYEATTLFTGGCAGVMKDGKWGVIDTKGATIVDNTFDDINMLSNGYFTLSRNKKWALFNKEKQVTDFIYEETLVLSDDMLPVKKNGSWGFINTQGQEVIPCAYDGVYGFKNNIAAVNDMYSWKFINKKGQQVITPTFMKAAVLSSHALLIQQKGDYLVVKNPLSQ